MTLPATGNGYLKEFITLVNTVGIARNSRYETLIKFPGEVQSYVTGNEDKLRLFCSRVSIPTLSYMTFEHNTFGETRTVPYQKKYDPMSMTFYMDQMFDIKLIFDKWMSYCFDMRKRTSNYYKDYAKDCTLDLSVFNVDENAPAYTIKFFEIYPKAVQEIPLGAERKDHMTLTVVFNYKYYEVGGVDSYLL